MVKAFRVFDSWNRFFLWMPPMSLIFVNRLFCYVSMIFRFVNCFSDLYSCFVCFLKFVLCCVRLFESAFVTTVSWVVWSFKDEYTNFRRNRETALSNKSKGRRRKEEGNNSFWRGRLKLKRRVRGQESIKRLHKRCYRKRRCLSPKVKAAVCTAAQEASGNNL